jgi:hypothetical protein
MSTSIMVVSLGLFVVGLSCCLTCAVRRVTLTNDDIQSAAAPTTPVIVPTTSTACAELDAHHKYMVTLPALSSFTHEVLTVEDNRAEKLFLQCAIGQDMTLGLSMWNVYDELQEQLTPYYKRGGKVSLILQSYDMSLSFHALPMCKTFIDDDYLKKMARKGRGPQERMQQAVPVREVNGTLWGVREFDPTLACASHQKLMVAMHEDGSPWRAMVRTFNALGPRSMDINYAVFIHDASVVQSLYDLHRWDFLTNFRFNTAPQSMRDPQPTLDPRVFPYYMFSKFNDVVVSNATVEARKQIPVSSPIFSSYDSPMHDEVIQITRMLEDLACCTHLTLMSPSFSDERFFDKMKTWLSGCTECSLELISTYAYFGVDELKPYHDDHLFQLQTSFPGRVIVYYAMRPTVHAKMYIFDKCQCEHCPYPMLTTSANQFPGQWISRDLGVLTCEPAYWNSIQHHLRAFRTIGDAQRLSIREVVEWTIEHTKNMSTYQVEGQHTFVANVDCTGLTANQLVELHDNQPSWWKEYYSSLEDHGIAEEVGSARVGDGGHPVAVQAVALDVQAHEGGHRK